MKVSTKSLKDSKLIWYSISTLILAGLIYTSDINSFLNAISGMSLFYMSLAFISGLSVFLVWGYVWHSFFVKLGINKDIFKSYNILMAGNFMNSITPLGQLGGEPFMAYVVSENTDASYEKSLSSVISSDIVNMIPFLTYTIAGVAYIILFGTLTSLITKGIYAIMIGSILLIIGTYLIWFKTQKLENKLYDLLNFIESHLGRGEKYIASVKARIKEFRETFEEVGEDPKHLVKTALVGHLAPLSGFLSLYLILIGQGVDPSITGIYFTTILSGLAMFSPTPGGSGAYEAAFSGFLLFFHPGMSPGIAVASAILFRLTNYWPGILIGYLSLISLKRE